MTQIDTIKFATVSDCDSVLPNCRVGLARVRIIPGVNRVWLGLGSRCLLSRNMVVKIMSRLRDIEINSFAY